MRSNIDSPQSEYRSIVAGCLNAARTYAGLEYQYQSLFSNLFRLEEWLKGANLLATDHIARDQEAAQTLGKPKCHSISDILDVASQRFSQHLRRILEQEAHVRELDHIVTIQMPQVILPSGDGGLILDEGLEPFEPPRFHERLHELLIMLEDNGIFLDDVIVIHGIVDSHMMRKKSYSIVEIPRLGREILLCDQVGEATFVVNGILNRLILAGVSKEQLQSTFIGQVRKVIYRNTSQWQADLTKLLFSEWEDTDVSRIPGHKIDVRTCETLRAEIIKRYKDHEQWIKMSKKQKLAFKVDGLGLYAIATKFGVKGDPIHSTRVHAELGIKIFGSDL